jgi:hypothetical protein
LDILNKYIGNFRFPIDIYYNNGYQNCGIARNRLIQKFNGDYLYFLDSDDFIEDNCIQLLVNYALDFNADIVISSYQSFKENENVFNKFSFNTILNFNSNDLKNFIYINKNYYPLYVWNKLFSLKYIQNNNFIFNEIEYGEDAYISFYEIQNDYNKLLVPNITYNYLLRSTSLTRSEASNNKLNEIVKYKEFVFTYLNDNHDYISSKIKLDIYVTTYILIVRDCFKSKLIDFNSKKYFLKKSIYFNSSINRMYIFKSFYNKNTFIYLITKNIPLFLNLLLIYLYLFKKNTKTI